MYGLSILVDGYLCGCIYLLVAKEVVQILDPMLQHYQTGTGRPVGGGLGEEGGGEDVCMRRCAVGGGLGEEGGGEDVCVRRRPVGGGQGEEGGPG